MSLIHLGKKSEIFGADMLEPIQQGFGANNIQINYTNNSVSHIPKLKEGFQLVAGADYRIHEDLYVCETLEDATQVYQAYASGNILDVKWYQAPDPGFITILKL